MQKRILVVDDSAMVRHIVGKLLSSEGYVVLFAKDGKEGCELANEHLPDAVIMDIEMPNMNGIDATARIKLNERTSHIPVIMLTSLGGELDMETAKAAGAVGFLNKPVCREDLHFVATLLGT